MCFDIGIVVCGPNEALVISGMFQGNTPSLLTGQEAAVWVFRSSFVEDIILWCVMAFLSPGGRAIVCPGIQSLQRIDLTTMTLEIKYGYS